MLNYRAKATHCLVLLSASVCFASAANAVQSPKRDVSDVPSADRVALQHLRASGDRAQEVRAYSDLVARGSVAVPALREGLLAKDWKQRLLAAVLFARLDPKGADLDDGD